MMRARRGAERGLFTAVATGAAAFVVVAVLVEARGGSAAVAEPPPAYEMTPLPAGIDSLTPLSEVALRLEECATECLAALYLWTPRMPLSRAGIANVVRAAERVGASLTLVAFEEVAEYAERPERDRDDTIPLVDAVLAAGALAHAPALVALRDGEPQGPAILGYKSAAAFESALTRRLVDAPASPVGAAAAEAPAAPASAGRIDPDVAQALRVVDYDVIGIPGAYFRWVPGRQAVAYESRQQVYLLDLADRENRRAPGYIDFVPTPDGRYFVTPGQLDGGLTFYDAEEVFEAVRRGRPGSVTPIFTDLRMRDQYPSVGILEQNEGRTLYRVMTSWFEGVVYRDYDVRVDPGSGVSSVRPVGEPVTPCAGVALSTPIMSPDGLEVAGRDESTGTTKIFGILADGRCDAITDLGVPTSKVAWHRTGRRLAFSIPRRRRDGDEAERGIFVLDRDGPGLRRVPESEDASRLAFPDFVGDASVVFLVPSQRSGQGSVFRLVDLAGSE